MDISEKIESLLGQKVTDVFIHDNFIRLNDTYQFKSSDKKNIVTPIRQNVKNMEDKYIRSIVLSSEFGVTPNIQKMLLDENEADFSKQKVSVLVFGLNKSEDSNPEEDDKFIFMFFDSLKCDKRERI